jgi:hypothetical protein
MILNPYKPHLIVYRNFGILLWASFKGNHPHRFQGINQENAVYFPDFVSYLLTSYERFSIYCPKRSQQAMNISHLQGGLVYRLREKL